MGKEVTKFSSWLVLSRSFSKGKEEGGEKNGPIAWEGECGRGVLGGKFINGQLVVGGNDDDTGPCQCVANSSAKRTGRRRRTGHPFPPSPFYLKLCRPSSSANFYKLR